jgi:hypothetical protein
MTIGRGAQLGMGLTVSVATRWLNPVGHGHTVSLNTLPTTAAWGRSPMMSTMVVGKRAVYRQTRVGRTTRMDSLAD